MCDTELSLLVGGMASVRRVEARFLSLRCPARKHYVYIYIYVYTLILYIFPRVQPPLKERLTQFG